MSGKSLKSMKSIGLGPGNRNSAIADTDDGVAAVPVSAPVAMASATSVAVDAVHESNVGGTSSCTPPSTRKRLHEDLDESDDQAGRDVGDLSDLNDVLNDISPQKAVVKNRFLLWYQQMKRERKFPVAIEVR